MLCPKCRNTMREREKAGVLIDVCPACRSVWLEAGELEKLIESERRYYELIDGDSDGSRYPTERHEVNELKLGYDRPRVEKYRCHKESEGQPKRRGSFLSNVFEVFANEGGG